MKASLFQTFITYFPLSPINAIEELPDSLEAGKTLTYIARIDKECINAIVAHCTGEDPESKKFNSKTHTPTNWKYNNIYDAEGNILKAPQTVTRKNGDEHEKDLPVKRWEPVQFEHNRDATAGHFHNLKARFVRTGYKHQLRTLVFDNELACRDGQHSLLALWYYLNDYEVEYVDVDVKLLGASGTEVFRLFDQAQRKRSVKDALSTIPGLPTGFEAEIASALRFSVLIANGRGINASRLTLPHIVNDKQKPITLQPDDVAGLITSGEPFEYYSDLMAEVLKSTSKVYPEDTSKTPDTMPTLCHPLVSGPGRPNPQYYLVAFANALYDTKLNLTEPELYAKFRSFLEEIYLGAESTHKSIIKLCTFKPTKAVEQLPAIESMLYAYLTESEKVKLTSKVLSFNGIESKYNEWYEANYSEGEPEEEETEEDSSDD